MMRTTQTETMLPRTQAETMQATQAKIILPIQVETTHPTDSFKNGLLLK